MKNIIMLFILTLFQGCSYNYYNIDLAEGDCFYRQGVVYKISYIWDYGVEMKTFDDSKKEELYAIKTGISSSFIRVDCVSKYYEIME